MRQKPRFKKGATSIYVVVITMLLLAVITTSFIRIVASEAARTTSNELAKAAYDSALAGVEDTKLAIKQYYACLNGTQIFNKDGEDRCPQIKAAMEKGFSSSDANPSDADFGYCDAISVALGRAEEGVEVPIQESSGTDSKFEQAYTCVMIDKTLDDYRSTLSANTPMRVIALKTDSPETVTGIRIMWYTSDDGPLESMNFMAEDYFPTNKTEVATPPVLSAHVVQTSTEFTLEEFDNADGNKTNNATVVFRPASDGIDYINAETLAKSNDHSTSNDAKGITCSKNNSLSSDFACVASLQLPTPIGNGTRRSDTFYLFLSLPYERPKTTFSVQLCTDDDAQPGDCMKNDNLAVAKFKDAQFSVDSTGRANNMYTRVEARIEFNDIYSPLPEHALYSTDPEGVVDKNFYVTSDCWTQGDNWQAERCDNSGTVQ